MSFGQDFSQRYELFGRLILQPFNESLSSQLSMGLQNAIDSLPTKSTPAETADERSALHYDIFGFEIQSYAGAYLHPQGLVGGEQTDRANQLCAALGIQIDPTNDSVEHLGRQLQLLSMLSTQEEHERAALELLDELLLTWLPVVLVAIHRYGQPFYSMLSQEIWQLVGEHRSCFADKMMPVNPHREGLLSDPKTGLKQVVHYLVTPIRSGCYFSRASIGAIARSLSLPRGFGSRYQMLESLLFTAVDQEVIPLLMVHLEKELMTWEQRYTELEKQKENLRPIVAVWKKRLEFTRAVLGRLKEVT